MNIFSVKATLWEIERAAHDAHYRALCHGILAESKAKALEWQFARKMLIANQD